MLPQSMAMDEIYDAGVTSMLLVSTSKDGLEKDAGAHDLQSLPCRADDTSGTI